MIWLSHHLSRSALLDELHRERAQHDLSRQLVCDALGIPRNTGWIEVTAAVARLRRAEYAPIGAVV